MLYVPEARVPGHCTYAVLVPASAVLYVPRTVAPQAARRVVAGCEEEAEGDEEELGRRARRETGPSNEGVDDEPPLLHRRAFEAKYKAIFGEEARVTRLRHTRMAQSAAT